MKAEIFSIVAIGYIIVEERLRNDAGSAVSLAVKPGAGMPFVVVVATNFDLVVAYDVTMEARSVRASKHVGTTHLTEIQGRDALDR